MHRRSNPNSCVNYSFKTFSTIEVLLMLVVQQYSYLVNHMIWRDDWYSKSMFFNVNNGCQYQVYFPSNQLLHKTYHIFLPDKIF